MPHGLTAAAATRIPLKERQRQKPLAAGGTMTADLGLYLHIPFSRTRCHFCSFKVYTGRTKDEISAYVDAVACEIASYAEKPAMEGRPPAFLYFGGGTPSYLSVRNLHRLHDALSARF